MRTALDAKLPKLHAARSTDGHSVLVLEDQDMQLSNAAVVLDALWAAITGRSDTADDVYLVETIPEENSPFYVYALKVGDAFNPNPFNDCRCFDASALTVTLPARPR